MLLPYIHIPLAFRATDTSSVVMTQTVPTVPFYSQFKDISSTDWQKRGCGIASLAMLIDFYKPGTTAPNTLLAEGIKSGAYISDAGWSHQGLANLAAKHGLAGKTYDLSALGSETAFAQFEAIVADGPVMVSIHYKFDPLSTIPHLVVINGIDGDTIYYNDPAAQTGAKTISTADFIKGWKKRFITVRPMEKTQVAER
jgi:ABC-type bacteriocin/lantibiotic exporter with double-glycine peptidase domain